MSLYMLLFAVLKQSVTNEIHRIPTFLYRVIMKLTCRRRTEVITACQTVNGISILEGQKNNLGTEVLELSTCGVDKAIRLEWRVHPFRHRPWQAPVILSAMAFSALIGYQLFHSPIVSFAAIFMVFGATSEYWWATKYSLTSEGAYARGLTARFELPWKEVRRQLIGEDGVKLSPLPKASRLDAYRGVMLRYPDGTDKTTREDVLGMIESALNTVKHTQPAEDHVHD